MAKRNAPLSGSNLGASVRTRAEPLINGRQDVRRMAGVEMGWWQQALSHSRPPVTGPQDSFPANVYIVGDSIAESYGTTDDYHKWTDLLRQAIQSRYRSGGMGYIPIKHTQAATWPYSSNPDGKNIFPVTAGAETDNVDYGFGLGRRSSYFANGCARTGTIDCDRFWIAYTGSTSTGTITIDVDPGTPFALTTTFNTATVQTSSGRIWDSSVNGGWTLTPGPHVIRITATTGIAFIDGVAAWYTDAVSGVHIYEGAHGAYAAADFSPSLSVAGERSYWTDIWYQPYTPAIFTDFVGNGTTTVTSASAAFTTLDIGEYIIFSQNNASLIPYSVARIVARNSATSITVDRVIQSTTFSEGVSLNRAQFTDGVLTSGSRTMTSATAAFNPWDVGMYVQGPTGIPAGTYIRRWNSATSVELSNLATASQSAQTVRILGRQRNWTAPDLLLLEFGVNDISFGVTTDSFKSALRDIAASVERSGIGFPVGQIQRYRPTVVLMGVWAPAWKIAVLGNVTAVSGSPFITSDKFDFDPVSDVGLAINTPSNTPIPAGTTLVTDATNTSTRMKMSQNAVASATAQGQIVNRLQLDKHWQPYRQAMFELCSEKAWRMFDLYSLGGYIDTTDPLNLTLDLCHPSNKGSQWVADELDILLTGQPKNAAIPQGIIDLKGDLIVGSTADVAGKLTAGVDGQLPTYASGSTLGLIGMDAGSSSLLGQVVPVVGGTTALTTGLPAPTLTATASNADDNEATWINHATSAVSFNASGVVSAAFTVTRAGRLPEFFTYIKTDPLLITSIAYAVGLSSASLDVASAVAPAASVVGAYFLYNTTVHGTAFWRTVTSDGTTRNTQTTLQGIAAATTYRMRIAVRGVRGSSVSAVDFYINDLLVATHTANLPTFSTPLGYGVRVETLLAGARNLKWARIALSGP